MQKKALATKIHPENETATHEGKEATITQTHIATIITPKDIAQDLVTGTEKAHGALAIQKSQNIDRLLNSHATAMMAHRVCMLSTPKATH